MLVVLLLQSFSTALFNHIEERLLWWWFFRHFLERTISSRAAWLMSLMCQVCSLHADCTNTGETPTSEVCCCANYVPFIHKFRENIHVPIIADSHIIFFFCWYVTAELISHCCLTNFVVSFVGIKYMPIIHFLNQEHLWLFCLLLWKPLKIFCRVPQ